MWGWDSSVVISTGYGMDVPGSNPGGDEISAPVQTGPGAHTASYIIVIKSLPGIKRPGRGVDHPSLLVPRFKEE
jgi:hypothetical protein